MKGEIVFKEVQKTFALENYWFWNYKPEGEIKILLSEESSNFFHNDIKCVHLVEFRLGENPFRFDELRKEKILIRRCEPEYSTYPDILKIEFELLTNPNGEN